MSLGVQGESGHSLQEDEGVWLGESKCLRASQGSTSAQKVQHSTSMASGLVELSRAALGHSFLLCPVKGIPEGGLASRVRAAGLPHRGVDCVDCVSGILPPPPCESNTKLPNVDEHLLLL